MTTSIIIVNYNSGDSLAELLDSLATETRDDTEVIVVDNHSADESLKTISQRGAAIRAVLNDENLGFARAVNQGIAASMGKLILLLNPDVVVSAGALREIENATLQDPSVGISGGKILGADGRLQLACRRGFPTPWVSFCRLSGLSFLFPGSGLFARYNLTYLNENEMTPVDAVSGSFMMIRRELLDRIGLFDEDFFLYAEDLDICYRAKKAGWTVRYVPSAVVVHKKGVCASKNPVRASYEFYNTMWTFHRKHFMRSTPFVLNLCIFCAVAVMKYLVPAAVAVRSKLRS
ncbi:MAG: glycosyltransferase family 2 protein [bacterium]